MPFSPARAALLLHCHSLLGDISPQLDEMMHAHAASSRLMSMLPGSAVMHLRGQHRAMGATLTEGVLRYWGVRPGGASSAVNAAKPPLCSAWDRCSPCSSSSEGGTNRERRRSWLWFRIWLDESSSIVWRTRAADVLRCWRGHPVVYPACLVFPTFVGFPNLCGCYQRLRSP